jgi:hypothetical protein
MKRFVESMTDVEGDRAREDEKDAEGEEDDKEVGPALPPGEFDSFLFR